MTDAAASANHRPGLPLAVVVGAGGMAMAIARRLGDSYRVLLADRDADHLERQVIALRSEGHEVHGITCDVVEPDAVRRLAAAAEQSGPVRALAHVVGLSPSMADGETVLRVNLVGPTLVADAFFELAGPGTAAVFVASLAGHLVELTPEQTAALDEPLAPDFPAAVAAAIDGELDGAKAYQLSKAALVRMCRDRAAAWGTRGARIVSLSPGLIADADGRARVRRATREAPAPSPHPAGSGRDDGRDRRRGRVPALRPRVVHHWHRPAGRRRHQHRVAPVANVRRAQPDRVGTRAMHDFVPSVAPMELRRRWHAEGLWNDDTFPILVARGLADNRSGRARVLSAVRPYEGTVGEFADQGALLAGLLAARGIGPGDVVAFQLPNWPEAASTFYGLLQLGVVVVPIVHIYGHREVGHILRQSRARTLITADRFGSHDYLAELALAAPLPDLELVVVVDAHGPFPAPDAESLTWREVLAADKPFGAAATVDPDAPAFVCYTSGTTSDAKGVVHSHRTFLAELRQGAALRGPADPAMVKVQGGLSGAPVGHVGGMLMLFGPVVAGSGLNLLDRWDPGLVLRTMAAEKPHVGQRGDVLPDLAPRPPRLRSRRARPPVGARRDGRRADPRGGRPARHGARHLADAELWIDRAPVDHRVEPRRPGRRPSLHRRCPAPRGGSATRGR